VDTNSGAQKYWYCGKEKNEIDATGRETCRLGLMYFHA
jgi:hypothetical protein